MRLSLFSLLLLGVSAGWAAAEGPVIEDARAEARNGSWTFHVTLSHPDTGWDHYADHWEIRGPDGAVLGVRPLAHPHVTEQPFTRSLSGVAIPEGVTTITVHARCNLEDWSAEPYTLKLAN